MSELGRSPIEHDRDKVEDSCSRLSRRLGFAVTGGITLKEHRPQGTEAEGGRVRPEPPLRRITTGTVGFVQQTFLEDPHRHSEGNPKKKVAHRE